MFVNLVPVFASIVAVSFIGKSFEVYHAVSLGLVLGGIALSEFGRQPLRLADRLNELTYQDVFSLSYNKTS